MKTLLTAALTLLIGASTAQALSITEYECGLKAEQLVITEGLMPSYDGTPGQLALTKSAKLNDESLKSVDCSEKLQSALKAVDCYEGTKDVIENTEGEVKLLSYIADGSFIFVSDCVEKK